MRFPDIPPMARTINLFKRLNLEEDLVEYRMKTENDLRYFNGIRASRAYIEAHKCEDVFNISKRKGGSVPDFYAQESADH
jgi:hypothetical protein